MKVQTESMDTSSVEKGDRRKKYLDYALLKDDDMRGAYNESINYHDSAIQTNLSRSEMFEVDFYENPTELYMRICASEWKGAMVALENNPIESKTWVVKRDPYDNDDEDNAVRFLPLHSACARQPPVDVVIGLLTVYPEAAAIVDDNGMYPLHYACANQASAEVVGLLLINHGPANMVRVDMGGSLPIHLSAQWGVSSPEVIDLLIQNNTSLACARDNDGLTPLEVAIHAEDYEFRHDVIELLQIYYEDEALNEGDDSTISTRDTHKKTRGPSLAALHQTVDKLREEVDMLQGKQKENSENVKKLIEMEWKTTNATIADMKQKIVAMKQNKKTRPLKSEKDRKLTGDDNVESKQEKTFSQRYNNSDLKVVGDEGTEELTNEDISYEITGNPFDSKSFEEEDISSSIVTTQKSEFESEGGLNQDVGLGGALNKKSNLGPTSKDSKGSVSPWLRQWRKLAGRKSRSADGSCLESIDEPSQLDEIDDTKKLFKEIFRKDENDSQDGPRATALTKANSPSLSSRLVLNAEDKKSDVHKKSADLSKINQENELMNLEYASLIRRRDAHVSKLAKAQKCLSEFTRKIREAIGMQEEMMRKLQILKDDFKVTTAVRRAHLKSMLSDMDDDDTDLQRVDVERGSAGMLKKERKTLDALERLLYELKS